MELTKELVQNCYDKIENNCLISDIYINESFNELTQLNSSLVKQVFANRNLIKGKDLQKQLLQKALKEKDFNKIHSICWNLKEIDEPEEYYCLDNDKWYTPLKNQFEVALDILDDILIELSETKEC